METAPAQFLHHRLGLVFAGDIVNADVRAGVPEGERQEIFETIDALPADVSILLIEHDMDLVFNFAKTVTVLVNGAVFTEGDVKTVSQDPRVKAVYLGEDHAHG